MGLFKKRDPIVEVEKALDHEVHEMEHDIQADVDAVMKKYDRESNTRIWEGAPKIALRVLMSAFSIYCILMTLFSKALPERRLSLFLGFIIIIGYLVYPARKGAARVNHVPWYDWILMVLGAGSFFYFAINAFSIIQLATKLQPIHIIVGAIGIVVLIELCRRCVGLPILVVLGLLLIYTFYNQLSWDPSFYKALKNIVYKLFYTTSGVIGTPVSVCYTYIVLFIIFGAFLERTGIANFFISFANRLAGWSSGGPAKVAVISSALCGMVSGSSVGNTVTTGSVTIPLMKKTGYPPQFAGAVEAAASTGGQIMPPIMGAAAFLMAEMTGESYNTIIVRAILPAFLYFAGIFIMVHFKAKSMGLKGLKRSELPKFRDIWPKFYLLLPLVVLVYTVMQTGSFTMAYCAVVSSLVAIVASMMDREKSVGRKLLMLIPGIPLLIYAFGMPNLTAIFPNATSQELYAYRDLMTTWFLPIFFVLFIIFTLISEPNRKNVQTYVTALEGGTKSCLSVGVACGMAGIVAGVVTSTGLGQIIINAIVAVAGDQLIIALVLTMLCCIVLGMGVPTTANYVIMATTCAPILIQMGVPLMAAHFFVFYFGIVADITPPVALAAYAGSAIAKADPMKTGLNATRLAIAAFIVPYIFVFSPIMLFIGEYTVFDVVRIVVTSSCGMFLLGAGLIGFMLRKLNMVLRLVCIAAGLCMIDPGAFTDLIGAAVLVVMIVYQVMLNKKEAVRPA